ncbi:hypothetical protein [Haloquadratum walsbyi]|jgi:hypothetical protein|uniref:Uncharacterized protein n=1 Tax=Haloquadratum walsbyi J07HQW2 TaxID=1238425 RepID=U1PQ93_9EURY|nr:hypothetical protein [Haloquadratum walsbyi]ERG95917.1 MAG: hypothetical protein J07HQW2_02377 [Haloquadratum walsbyi J07HQW2]
MFDSRELSSSVAAVKDTYAPDAVVLDVESDFETLPPAIAEGLGIFVEGVAPASYPAEWLPSDVPSPLTRYASSEFTIGMPGDGTVTWTRQTTPPTILIKQRAAGTPTQFLEFLIAEAIVQIDTGAPEHFLPFFESAYTELDSAIPLGSADAYQVAAALYDAWVGLQTRSVFKSWEGTHPEVYDAWDDAGNRLDGRLKELPGAVARGETAFADATEYACSAVKHDLELPTPFTALDTQAYLEYDAEYAVRWARKTFEKLDENENPL